MEPRIGCRVPSGDASVNDFARTEYWRATEGQLGLSRTQLSVRLREYDLVMPPVAS